MMPATLTWLGHGCWLLHTGRNSIVIDPFLDDSPVAPVKSDQVQADYLLGYRIDRSTRCELPAAST